jgi:hypothetical protein
LIEVQDHAPATLAETKAERKVALEKAQAGCLAANAAVGEGFWDLGSAAKVIRDRLLFKEAGCKSFAEYADKALHLSTTHVNNAIAVSEGMPREQAGRVGVACSVAITKAPESVKAEIIKLAEMGVAPSKVRERATSAAKAARAAAGTPSKAGRKPGNRPRDIRSDLESAESQAAHDKAVMKGEPESLCGECQVVKEPGLMMISFSALGRKFVVRVKGDEAVFEAGR